MDLREVAVVRALQLGDLLCAVPALRALRSGFPSARITLIGLPWAEDFARRLPYVDQFIEFPGWRGIPERDFDRERFEAFSRALPRGGFDLAVQLHGDGRYMNDFLALIPARSYAAFVPADRDAGGRRPSRARLVPYPEDLPEPLRLLRLTERLGAPSVATDLEFPLEDAERAEAARLREEAGLLPGGYVCLHPGSGSGGRWPVEQFAEVARRLAATGQRVVVTGGAAERPLAEAIADLSGVRIVDLTGRTSLGTLGALLADARVLIANDTGVSHLAAALRVPSVIIFTTSDRDRWAPLDESLHIALGRRDEEPPTPAEVVAAATSQLARAA